MVKIAVTGASGMLGREVLRADPHNAHGWDRAMLDITNRANVSAMLRAIRPDVVINCAGLTKHRTPEPTLAEYNAVNAYGPMMLADECDRIGARLIHVSTDCVFSGKRPIEDGPYTEDEAPDAPDPYGASKAAGEITSAPHLTVRCSFVGLGDRGLIAWLWANEGGAVSGWMKAVWSGSTAPAIARALVELAQKPEVTGLMHLTDGKEMRKLTMLRMAVHALGIHVGVGRVDTPIVNRWLASNRFDVPVLPPLHEALRELAHG